MKTPVNCPCCSKKPYSECCKIYHDGKLPPTVEALMRSRYSAYALGLADYIMATTHPSNPHFTKDAAKWKKDVLAFSNNLTFEGLEVLHSKEFGQKGSVVFVAHLKQNGADCTFTERSRFQKVKGSWLYVDGDVVSGIKRKF